MFPPKRILVVGSSRIADAILEELSTAGRPVERMDDLDRATTRLRSASSLIVADPTTDARRLVDQVVEHCKRRSPRHPPLRLILVGAGDDARGHQTVPEGANLRVERFDPETQAARSLLARWPLHTCLDPPFEQIPHIMIAGCAPPAHALLVQCMRLVHYGDRTPVITLADEDAGLLGSRIADAFPQSGEVCRLCFKDIQDLGLADSPRVTSVYVCMTSPERGLATARHIAERIAIEQGASPLIHLEIGDARPSGSLLDWDGQLIPFSWLHEACRAQVLLDGLGDELARVIHEHYRDSIAAQGRDPDSEPAGRHWENLDASYRDASRHQSDHLEAKLATLDCRAVREELVESFTFAPQEAERLAIIEHKRWATDRYLDGWTYAPTRDNARKHHPQLIPYDDLSEPMKDLDRFAVRLTPALLARSGRGLVRMLLVAVGEPQGDCPTGQALQRLSEKALERLTERYPHRSLVLASTLQSDASRLVVRRALDDFESGLFLLCPRPLPEILANLATEGAGERTRQDLLGLAARAERRIPLAGERELAAWITKRAEINLILGVAAGSIASAKRVLIDPASDRLEWNFEY